MKIFTKLLGYGGLLALPLLAPAQSLTNSGAAITVQAGAVLYLEGGLLNQSGGSLTNGGQLLVGGDLTNTATLTSTGRLLLTGTAAQTFTPGTATVSRLQLSNAGPAASGQNVVTLAANLTVRDSVVLRSGLLRVAPGAVLDLPATGALTGEATGRYVQGGLRTSRPAVSGPVDFGLGLTLDATGQNLGTVTVLRTAGLKLAEVSYGQSVSGGAQGIDRLWTVSSQQAPTAALPLTLAWLPDDDNGLADFSQAQAWRQDAAGAPWVAAGTAQNASGLRRVSASAAALGRFTVSNGQNPLPVTLVAFTAQRQGPDGLLRWTTASELHNAYFQVESSLDGRTFQPLGRVAGQGTSTQAHDYQFTDLNLARYAVAQVYYRLRQVDTNGDAAYSPVRAVAVPLAAGLLVQAYPNPSALGQEVTLAIRTDQAGAATLWLTDVLGRELSQQQLTLGVGSSTLPLPGSAGLATGVYLVHLRQGDQQQTLKLVRQ